MKLLILLCIVVAWAAPSPIVNNYPQDVQIKCFKYDAYDIGDYNVTEQTDFKAEEEPGELKNAGTKDEYISFKGSYSWVGPDGGYYNVTYVTDENGCQHETGLRGILSTALSPAVVASLLG